MMKKWIYIKLVMNLVEELQLEEVYFHHNMLSNDE